MFVPAANQKRAVQQVVLAKHRIVPDVLQLSPEPFGYGYLLWLLPGTRRQFAMVGDLGQRVCVDPASKLVMVQTAVETRGEVWRLWSDVVARFG